MFFSIDSGLFIARDRTFEIALDRAIVITQNKELKTLLIDLKRQVPTDFKRKRDLYIKWWQSKGVNWIEQLREVMKKYFDIGHEWPFDENQKNLLLNYYYSNKLVLDCLAAAQKAGTVTNEVEIYIQDTLLLPIAEIEKHKHEKANSKETE